MELVDLMYRYINKFINAPKLLEELKLINLDKFNDNEKAQIESLIKEVENIINTIPNEIDDIEIKRKEQAQRLANSLSDALEKSDLDDETAEKLNKQYNSLLRETEITKDGGKLYKALFETMTQNELVSVYAKKMNDKELLKFITKYIYAPFPPVLEQNEFDDLVSAGIEEDKRESLWRLAFNYNRKNKDFSKIEDYFIEVRDDYYLVELVCAVKEDLNLLKIVEKVKNTNDTEFISKCVSYAKHTGIINDGDIKKLGLIEYLTHDN